MWTPLLLITFAATPCAQQQQRTPACPVCMQEVLDLSVTLNQVSVDVDEVASRAASRYVGLLEWLARERDLFRASIEELENATNHLVQELDIVRSRQAASAAVQASQVIMMVTYFLTILSVLPVFHLSRTYCVRYSRLCAGADFSFAAAARRFALLDRSCVSRRSNSLRLDFSLTF